MRKLFGLFLLAGLVTACGENGVVQVRENKADTVFDKVDAAAKALADSAKEQYKGLKNNTDSAR